MKGRTGSGMACLGDEGGPRSTGSQEWEVALAGGSPCFWWMALACVPGKECPSSSYSAQGHTKGTPSPQTVTSSSGLCIWEEV